MVHTIVLLLGSLDSHNTKTWKFSQHFLIEYLSFYSVLARNGKHGVKGWTNVFSLQSIILENSNWQNTFFRLVGKIISIDRYLSYHTIDSPTRDPLFLEMRLAVQIDFEVGACGDIDAG